MSDQPPATAAQAVEFFRLKGADGPCPICRSAKWLLHSGVDRGVDVFRVPRQVDYVLSNLQVYVMICENCGFVRQHVRDLVDGTMNPPSGGLFVQSGQPAEQPE
jgi:hypothetical protein